MRERLRLLGVVVAAVTVVLAATHLAQRGQTWGAGRRRGSGQA